MSRVMSNSELKEIYPKKKGLQQKRLLSCSMCPYQTNRNENLKKHRVSIHERGTYDLQCCGNQFANKADLRHHSVAFHSHGYVCNICGHVFNRRANLRGHHNAVHLGIKEFKCQLCDFATSCKSKLERHGKIHGSSTSSPMPSSSTGIAEEKLLTCSLCPYRTNKGNNLKRHTATMHEQSTSDLECCGNRFANKTALRHHTAAFHSHGYVCTICGHVFRYLALLRRHHAVHSGFKEFKCQLCDFETAQLCNLERHMKKMHDSSKSSQSSSSPGDGRSCDESSNDSDSQSSEETISEDPHPGTSRDHNPILASLLSQPADADDQVIQHHSTHDSHSGHVVDPVEDHGPLQKQPTQPPPFFSIDYIHLAQEGMMNLSTHDDDSSTHSLMNNPILASLNQPDDAADQVNQCVNDFPYDSCWGKDIDLLEDHEQPKETSLYSNLEHYMRINDTTTSSPMLSSSSLGGVERRAGSSNGSGSRSSQEFSTIRGDSHPFDDDAILTSLSQPDIAEDPVDQWIIDSAYDSYWGNDVDHLDEFCKHF